MTLCYSRHQETAGLLVTTETGGQENEEREAHQHNGDNPSVKKRKN